jgi:hypothetical protein
MRRSDVESTLRKAGLPDLAELVERSLPDPVELQEVQELLAPYGVNRDVLVDRMGGSP